MAMEYVNTVTLGDLAQIDLNKRTLFPLCHMMINTVDFGGDSGVFNFNVTIMSMDSVNEWKSDDGIIGDPLLMGNDNEQFVLNNTLTVLNKLNEFLYRGSLHNGDFEIDLNKRTIFPLVHMIVNSVNMGGDSGTLTFNITFMAMDIVNEFKGQDTIDKPLLMGEDNEQFVLNNTLTVLNKLNEFLYRGSLHDNNFEIKTAGSCQPFFDRFENRLAGWSYTADIYVANNLDICTNL